MNRVVVDASVALAWCFPDETNAAADRILAELEKYTLLIPAIWPLEIVNAVLVGARSHRLREPEAQRFLELLQSLPLMEDTEPVSESAIRVYPLARKYDLSAYDAAYLELAARRNASLATVDKKLRKAAERAGLSIFAGAP